MEGGLNAWNGLVATGEPDAGMAYFSDKNKPEEIIALAWSLEEGARLYYSGIEEMMNENSSKELFGTLAAAEVRHKALLVRLYSEMSGSADGPESSLTFTASVSGVFVSGSSNLDIIMAAGADRKEADTRCPAIVGNCF